MAPMLFRLSKSRGRSRCSRLAVVAPPEGPPPPAPAEEPSLASLFGGLDPSSLARFLPLLQELSGSQNDERARLLYALKPFLKPARQEKIDTALRLARLFHAGKRFFKEFGGAHV